MKLGPRLLWLDCSAGASVGLVVLLFHEWFSETYGFSPEFTLFLGGANLGYGCFSFALAVRRRRSTLHFKTLVAANLGWAALCFISVLWLWNEASVLGIGHLVLEGVFVGGLGGLEWRSRHRLNVGMGGGGETYAL